MSLPNVGELDRNKSHSVAAAQETKVFLALPVMNFHMFDKIINKIKKIRTEFNSNFFINVVSFPQAYKTSKGKNDVIFFFSFMHDGLGSLE